MVGACLADASYAPGRRGGNTPDGAQLVERRIGPAGCHARVASAAAAGERRALAAEAGDSGPRPSSGA